MLHFLRLGGTTFRALCFAAGLSLAFGSVHAGTVSVKEGETAHFQITVTPKFTRSSRNVAAPIRVWYDTDGGTAVEGKDYETAHSWANNVQGFVGSALPITVKTFEDDAVEGNETFNIRVRKVYVQVRGRWGHAMWRLSSPSLWNFSGVKTATIEDATPLPQQVQMTYEQQKYGSNYSGRVSGE